MSKAPLVSVVMSVYNGETYLRQSIDSILAQTYKEFEFIIIDDGSTDNSLKIVRSYDDTRIKIVTHENRGLIAALNEGIALSKGAYIARQDDDDVSLLNRLEVQVAHLQSNPGVAIVGSSFIMMSEAGETLMTFGVPINDADIKRELFIRNPLAHGSVLMNRQLLIELGGYPSGVGPIEDYELWVKVFLAGGEFAVIPKALYKWRHNPQGISFGSGNQQAELVKKLKDRMWAYQRPPKETVANILRRHKQYRALSLEVASHISTRLVDDQLELGSAYLRYGSMRSALRQWLLFALLVPTNFKIVWRGIKSMAHKTYHQVRSVFGRGFRLIGLRRR